MLLETFAEFLGGIIKGALRVLLFLLEFAFEWVLEYIFDRLCYYTGWTVLRLITIGKYPESEFNPPDIEDDHYAKIKIVGVISLVVLVVLAFIYT